MLTMHWPALSGRHIETNAMRRRMNHLLSDIYNTRFGGISEVEFEGRILDQGDKLVFTLDVPGFSNEDIDLELKDDVMTIKGERKRETLEGYKNHRKERTDIRFHHSFTLPVAVDSDKAEGVVKDGVLEVILPKSEEAMPRRIAVN